MNAPPQKRMVKWPGISILGIYMVFLGVFLIQNTYRTWPTLGQDAFAVCDTLRMGLLPVPPEPDDDTLNVVQDTAGQAIDSTAKAVVPAQNWADRIRVCQATISIFGFLTFQLTDITWGGRLLLIVLFMGALGSWVHKSSSYVRFVGNRTLVVSWVPWYVISPLIGSGVAVIFYVVLRAGFFSNSDSGGNTAFAVAAMSGLVGLFTDKATEKLSDVFDAMFGRKTEADSLEGNPTPKLELLEPTQVAVGADRKVVVKGSGFVADSIVLVDDTPHDASYQGESAIEVTFTAAELAAASGQLKVAIRNPEPGGGDSSAATLTVT